MTTLDGNPVHVVTQEDQERELLILRTRLGELTEAVAHAELRCAEAEQREADAVHRAQMTDADHHADIDRIGSRLLNEARQRDWCGEYDAIIEDLNVDLHVPLPRREFTYECRVAIHSYVTVTVRAHDEEDVVEVAAAMIGPRDVVASIRSRGYTTGDVDEITRV